jgi:hypothetical protein
MNKTKGFLMVLALMAGIVIWNSCEKEADDPENEANHNVGNDCLMCHKAGGGGEGIFTAAGSVFKAGTTIGATGAVIRLYTTADFSGTPVASMTSVVGGNFYTKSPINFGSGLYVRITSSTGASSMISPIVNGSCNSCHGSVTGKISVE